MSLNDKLYELKSLLAFDGVDKSIEEVFFPPLLSIFLAVCTGRGRPSKSVGCMWDRYLWFIDKTMIIVFIVNSFINRFIPPLMPLITSLTPPILVIKS